MSTWENIGNDLSETFSDYGERFIEFAPKLLVALIIFTIGSIIASAVANLVQRLVSAAESHSSVKSVFKKSKVNVNIAKTAALFVKWGILFVFLSAAVDVLEIDVLSETINSLVDFMPNIFAATVVAGVTFIGANIVKELVSTALNSTNIPNKSLITTAAVVAVWIIGLPMALAQLDVDVSAITDNVQIIVAGVMLAFAIAFGFGGKDVAGKILDNAYKSMKDTPKKKK